MKPVFSFINLPLKPASTNLAIIFVLICLFCGGMRVQGEETSKEDRIQAERGTTTIVADITDCPYIVSYTDLSLENTPRFGKLDLKTIRGRRFIVRTQDDFPKSQTHGSLKFREMDPFLQDSEYPCSLVVRSRQGQIAPDTDGGTFGLAAWGSTINSKGCIAFVSKVYGSVRSQGVFVADSIGVRAIAIGCGNGGGSGVSGTGCGDPTPIGGTFSGFFTNIAPDINDSGDVLFLAEVDGGSSFRGLFLYQAKNEQIIKVAAVGDPSPIGGTFDAIGTGSLNNNGQIVFLAAPKGEINSNIFLWDQGSVTKVAAMGEPAPGGGTYEYLGSQSMGFVDGTSIPWGPVPDINDVDQICFRATVNNGITKMGIIVREEEVNRWYIKASSKSPIGGTYNLVEGGSINDYGQIAFFADVRISSDKITGGIFTGTPGRWRKVVAGRDTLDGGECWILAVINNPKKPINSFGDVLFWADLNENGGDDRLVLSLADGRRKILVRNGQTLPGGGSITTINPWPSLNYYRAAFNSYTPGAPGGSVSAHMVCFIKNTLVSVDEITELPKGCHLGQNYPNPFNPMTRIGYTIGTPAFVELSVFDILGREVATLVNGVKQAGTHEVTWDAKGFASGVYYCRLRVREFTATRKLLLVR